MRRREDIDEVLNQCAVAEDSGETKYPGMSYEQGVAAGLRWAVADTDENPMSE